MTSIVEYVDQLFESWDGSQQRSIQLGFDEPLPMNVSRFLWLMSGQSQKLFEASVLGFGKN